jgi:hypothetical protein
VLALSFGPDFIHWRRSGESWPSVGLGRRLFYLTNEPVAVAVEQVWSRSASSGLATGRTGVAALTFSLPLSRARERGPLASGFDPGGAGRELWGSFGASRSKPLAEGSHLVNRSLSHRARARGAPTFGQQTDPLEPTGGATAAGRCRQFLFSRIRFGANDRSCRRRGDGAVGAVELSEVQLRGLRQQIARSAALVVCLRRVCALAFQAGALVLFIRWRVGAEAPSGAANLAIIGNKATANQSPLLRLCL